MGLHLLVGRGTIRAEARHRRRVIAAAEAAWDTPADLADRVAELAALPELGRAGTRLEIRLEAPLVQVRRLEGLPPVRMSALRPLVELRAAHFFRRNGVPLVVDARWLGRRRPGAAAVAAGAPAPVIAALLDGARQSGRAVHSIRPAGSEAPLDLLPSDERGRRIRRGLLRAAVVAAAGLALWVIAGVVFATRVARADRAAIAELDSLAPAVEALAALREQVARAETAVRAVEAVAGRRGRVLGEAIGAAAALPDSGWLVSLAVDTAGAGRLSVVAPSAMAVLAALERVGVRNPRIEGEPVPLHVQGLRRERFTLRFGAGTP